MSLQSEDRISYDEDYESSHHAKKQFRKFSYSREYLLSLSELESCKKLPSDFDASVLSEFEDVSYGTQGQRIPGSSPLLSYRRSEYGSSPPLRGDSSNYSRSTYGRWDSRSSGRSDRESDSQSDRDSDSGRRHGNPSRRSWQSSEHDGLLGSGSFPRPSGYGSGISAPKGRVNDNYQLNRTIEPYHPPRPYKATPHSRREITDSLNEETFGSSDGASEDQVEEERRRRASFELMRKEQQKALQEKQKPNPEKQKVNADLDISMLLDNTKGEKSVFGASDAVDESSTPGVSTNEFEKSTIISQTTTYRPLVPPGFSSTNMEKHTGLKSSTPAHKTEVAKLELQEILLHAQQPNGILDSLERQSSQDTTFSDHHNEDKTMHTPFLDKGEQIMSFPLSLGVADLKLGVEGHMLRTSSLSKTHESFDDPEIIQINAKVSSSKIRLEENQNQSTSILEKIFGSALPLIVSSSVDPIEQIESKPDDLRTSNSVQSSKFAHWFSEEERKSGDVLSNGRPNGLLSLIVGGDKGRSHLSDDKDTECFPSGSSHESSELATKLISNLSFKAAGAPERLYDSTKTEAIPTVLTCEDLEQTILSTYSDKSSDLQPVMQKWGVDGEKLEQHRGPVNNHASQHLLSLLQKGTSLNHMTSSPHAEVGPEKIQVSQARDIHVAFEESREEDMNNVQTSGKSVTLETLFGSAFMKELQSVEAPVSVQRGSVGSAQTNVLEPLGLSFPLMNNDCIPQTSNQVGLNRTSHQNDILPLDPRQENNKEKSDTWLGIGDSRMAPNSLKHQLEVNSRHGGLVEAAKLQLSEEESLFFANDPLKRQNSMFAGTSSKGQLSSNAPLDIAQKLAAIGAVVKEEQLTEGPENSPFVRGPYNRIGPEISQHNLHAQSSSPQFRPLQMSHGRPLLYPLDSHNPAHTNSQMKFMAPESMIHHDHPANRQFPANMIRPPFPRPSAGVTPFDLPAHNPMLPQMQISGNYPSNPLHEFPRSAVPTHPGNQTTSLMPELKPMQGFPFGPRQQNVGGLGMPIPAPDVNSGSNHPDAFQRLLEMELRAKSKQIHPHPLGHSQPMYGHELDMGFRHR